MLTAAAAGTLLGALWFVPSAGATPGGGDHRPTPAPSPTATGNAAISVTADTSGPADADDRLDLAETGSMDTTPYIVGGSVFLGVGAGFVAYSVRRRRTDAE
ncbi:hypothetical protein HUT18_09465 [Streptomyces sp. NA04227]|nr:hypothetical protein HUT18_09465 [Streptomyces sp. NA04227]